jgi:nickel/cobalt exporter
MTRANTVRLIALLIRIALFPRLHIIAGLFALLTFSPCEAFLPVFLLGAKYGWIGFALLSAILAIGTVAGMVVFTGLTLAGLEKLKFRALEKFESGILGGVLCLLGILIMLLER